MSSGEMAPSPRFVQGEAKRDRWAKKTPAPVAKHSRFSQPFPPRRPPASNIAGYFAGFSQSLASFPERHSLWHRGCSFLWHQKGLVPEIKEPHPAQHTLSSSVAGNRRRPMPTMILATPHTQAQTHFEQPPPDHQEEALLRAGFALQGKRGRRCGLVKRIVK